MKRFLLATCLTLAALYLGACLILFSFQRAFIYFPNEVAKIQHSEDLTLEVKGASLKVTVRAHAGADALVYFGGNAEDVSRSLEPFAKGFPDRAIYLMHYRGYGGSSGKPSEKALFADALALFDRVHARHPNVVVVGRSLGSGLAIQVAAARPVQRLLLITPYDSLVNLGKRQYPFFPVGLLMLDRYESWRAAPQVKAPTLLLAAANDEVIPGESTAALLRAFAPGVAKLRTLAGVGHNSISASPEYMPALRGSE